VVPSVSAAVAMAAPNEADTTAPAAAFSHCLRVSICFSFSILFCKVSNFLLSPTKKRTYFTT
jgi:hypothetical protein